ncbi:beta-cyclopiazonate dehydrogenase [Aspergillus venezuelensis]
MTARIAHLFLFLAGNCLAATSRSAHQNTIFRDVVILGGGSTGVYSAIQLRDRGLSIAVIERNDRLGGHGETYYTEDNTPLNYGVEGFFNTSITRVYLERLQVRYGLRVSAPAHNEYVNLLTGERTDPPPGQLDDAEAFPKWTAAISQFDFLEDGSYNLPDRVPEDLLLPFGEFVRKYNVEDTVYSCFTHTGFDVLEMITLYVIQFIGIPHAAALTQGYIRPFDGIAGLYIAAGRELGEDVLLKTTIDKVVRSEDGVTVTVHNADGIETTLQARYLLVTIPPLLHELQAFDLSTHEVDLFSRWQYHQYWAVLVNDTGLPSNLTVVNVDPNRAYGVPAEPFLWRIHSHLAPGYHNIKLGGYVDFDEARAREFMQETLSFLNEQGTYTTREANIVQFGNHSPTLMFVTAEDIRDGFYRELYRLQGRNSTFWTGAAWASDYSTLLWGFTEGVLGMMDFS